MRILLIGKNGQVGWELERCLASLGEVVAVDFPEIDLANPGQIRQVVRQVQPGVIVNAAAYTNVDQAEAQPELAFAVNAAAPGVLAEEAQRMDATLVHYSTDYVFDGQKGAPYVESDLPNPLSVYGQSKLAGERAVQAVDGTYLILRTSWVYSTRQKCFLSQVLNWAKEKKTLRIVTDQVGSPTWCRRLAELTGQVLSLSRDNPARGLPEKKGLYHLAGAGSASRLAWAQAILSASGNLAVEIQPALTSDFPAPARRPLFSALNCDHFTTTFGLQLPNWETELRSAMESAA